jgi:hypothetical protein
MKPFFCVPIIKFVSNNDNFDTSKSFLLVIQYKYSKINIANLASLLKQKYAIFTRNIEKASSQRLVTNL